jgi:26S proteasome regulatory subunit N13
VLVEFKAGRLFKDSNTKWVRPDKRKGQVQLKQSGEDGLIHFVWKDRSTGIVETDLIIFPEEAAMRRVNECKTGRVYLLEFKTSDQKLFFWMQESKEDKDQEYADKLNQYINSPPQPGQAGGLPGGLEGLGNLDQQQLLQMLTGGLGRGAAGAPTTSTRRATPATPATPASTQSTAPTTASTTSSAPSGQGADVLSSILQSMAQQQQQQQERGPKLSDVLAVDEIIKTGVLSDPAVQEQLLQFLAPEERTTDPTRSNEQVLAAVLRSPQFKQAVTSFAVALKQGMHGGSQGQLANLLRSFGLNPDTLNADQATGGNVNAVEAFLRALQQQMDKKENKQ